MEDTARHVKLREIANGRCAGAYSFRNSLMIPTTLIISIELGRWLVLAHWSLVLIPRRPGNSACDSRTSAIMTSLLLSVKEFHR